MIGPISGVAMLKRFLCAALFVLTATNLARAADVTGVPQIISADTVNIGKARLRLAISAPSLEQFCLDASGERWTCGLTARDELIKHVGTKSWTCQTTHTDVRDRTVANCTVEGEDIAKWAVQSGWALARVLKPVDYEADQAAAKAAKAGIWAGAFIAPRDWRRRNKSPALGSVAVTPETHAILLRGHFVAKPPSPECAIKGHVNASGTCIYHLPASRWYARVIMEPDNGDRWFCSKEEAELASCRETKR
jgi:endonuclease YncB( thermonuclease family)